MAWIDQQLTDLKNGFKAVAADVKAMLPRLVPSGGAPGQVLTKQSATAFDMIWQAVSQSPTRSITLTDANGVAVATIEIATDPASPTVQAIHIRPVSNGSTRLYLGGPDNPLYSVKFFAQLLENLPGFTFANALSLGQDGGISINRSGNRIILHSGGGADAGVDFSTNNVDYGVAGATNSSRRMRLTALGRLLLQNGGGDGSSFTDDGVNILQAKGHVSMFHLVGGTALPTFTSSTGSGTSPNNSLNTDSHDMAGQITIVTGTSPAANAVVIRITYNQTFTKAPRVGLTQRSLSALVAMQRVFVSAETTTYFEISSGATALAASTTYVLNYHVIQ